MTKNKSDFITKFKLDMNIFKRYFLLIKDILSFKAIDEDGNEQNAFYLNPPYDIDNLYKSYKTNKKREVNEALRFIIPYNNTISEYLNINLCLNNHFYAKNICEIIILHRMNENIFDHNYYLMNFAKEIINNNPKLPLYDYDGMYKKYAQFRKENINRLKELSNKIDNYNIWLYDYKMKHYFNNDYEIIHKLSENESINVNKLYKIIRSNYKYKPLCYYFYSFCSDDILLRRHINKDLFIKDLKSLFDKEKIYQNETISLPYKPYAVVKNKDNNIGILFTIYDELINDEKYEENKLLVKNRFNYDGIVAELIINNRKVINYLFNDNV